MNTYAELKNWILAHDDIAVITHIRPDGDALGSGNAMVLMLRALGKHAYLCCDNKGESRYDFLPLAKEIYTVDTVPYPPKACLCVDVSEKFRCGDFEKLFEACGETALVDHHKTNPGFADVNVIEGEASSAGEILVRIAEELGIKLDKQLADCLYSAISTDTGNFSFSCTVPEAYIYAARCVEAGTDVEQLSRILFRTRTEAATRLLGLALTKIEMSLDKKVALIALSDDDYRSVGASQPDSHAIVNYLNEIAGVTMGILIDEQGDGVKLSLRSNGDADVAAFAKIFGGGGHTAAAGASINGISLDEAKKLVMEAAVRFIGE